MLSATATMLGQEFEIPYWVPEEQIPIVQQLAAAVTTTGSTAPIYTTASESMPLIGMDAYRADAQYAGADGTGFAAVIIDTGADLDHPYFGDRIVYQQDFADDDFDASDVNGHGTNVASITAGFQENVFSGVAPGADLIILKVFEDGGAGNFGYVETALRWVINNAGTYNIASVNMSLGDGGNYNTPQALYGISDEISLIADMGVTVVSAAGNSFYQYGSVQGVAYPAADINSLAVSASYDANVGGIGWAGGAVDFTTAPDRVASFSQRHATMTDVFAPGALITGAGLNGGQSTFGGTSQAAPHIAGVALLAQQLSMQETGQRLDLEDMQSLLSDTGVPIVDGDDEDDNVVNTGLTFRRVDMEALANTLVTPKVTAVAIGSSLSGSPDYSIPAGQQLNSVPVGRANEIKITFDEQVTVEQADLDIAGVITASSYNGSVNNFTYDSPTKTATWTLSAEIPVDQIALTLSDSFEDLAGNALDGEWSNPATVFDAASDTFPSGNGTGGGDFVFHFTVLPGDLNGDTEIDYDDFLTMDGNNGLTGATYQQGDVNGDGTVGEADYDGYLKPNYGTILSVWQWRFLVSDLDLDLVDVDYDDIDDFVQLLMAGTLAYINSHLSSLPPISTPLLERLVDEMIGDANGDDDTDFDDIANFVATLNLTLLPDDLS